MSLHRQFLRFCLVGVGGFLVDGGVVQLLAFCGVNLYGARVVSFLLAATATWALNRHFTFRLSGTKVDHREWVRYVMTTSLGAFINYGVYVLCLRFWPLTHIWPVLGVAAGSAIALGFNFLASKYLIFKQA